MAKDVFVSVCMIVKNEERYLARALESTRELADEIIVVDTGSSDATVAIAREHGARVFRFDWVGDFAAARNASLRPARGEWILVLDADEYLKPGHAGRLRRMLEETGPGVVGYRVYQTNLLDEEGDRIIDKSTTIRVFRNRASHRYQFPIHEQIVDTLSGGSVEPSDIELMHSGFIQSVSEARGKAERNRTLLERFLEELPAEHPHRTYVHMQLGTEYRRIGDLERAFEHIGTAFERLEGIVSVPHNRAYATILLNQYVLLAIGRGEPALALAAADRALAAGLDAPSVWFSRGWAQTELGHISEAVRDLLWSIALGEQGTGREEFVSAVDMENAWFLATSALLHAGALPAAAAMVIHALRWAPDGARFLAVASALAAMGNGELRSFVVERCPEPALAGLASLSLAEGRFDTTSAAAARLETLGDAAAVLGLARDLLARGEGKRALPMIAAAYRDERTRPEVAAVWAVLVAMLGRPLEERLAVLRDEPDADRRAVFAEMVGGARAPRQIGAAVYASCKQTLARYAMSAEAHGPDREAPQEETA